MSLAEPRTLLERLISEGSYTWQEVETRFDERARARGERVSLSWRQLQRIAAGEIGRPRPAVARVLADLFGRAMEDLLGPPSGADGVQPHAALEPADAPRTDDGSEPDVGPLRLVERLRLVALEPRRVGWPEVEQVRFMTASVAANENLFGGGSTTEIGPAALRRATALLSARASSEVRRALYEAVGNLAQVVGFVAFDVDDRPAAARLFDAAFWCAEQSGSWALRSAVLTDVARQHLAVGEFEDALSAVEFAQVRQDRLTATGRAAAGVIRAQVLSGMNRHGDARAEVDRADAEFAHHDPTIEPPWLTYYDEAEHAGSTAKALMPLDVVAGRPGPAAQRLVTAVDRQRADYPRSQDFSATRLAVLQLQVGDPREAVVTAQVALDRAGHVRSRRLKDHFDRLAQACRRHPRVQEVRDLAAVLAVG